MKETSRMTTEDRREGNGRRMDDEFTAKLDDHIVRFNEFEVDANNRWDQLLHILEGPEIRRLDGSVERDGGVLKEVRDINAIIANGGVRIKLPVGVWGAIIVAVLSGIFTVVAAVVG